MSNQNISSDTLRVEYTEAGAACRACEQLTRTTFNIALPALTALVAYIEDAGEGSVVLAIAGILFAFLAISMIRRQRVYYLVYLARIKEIESELGMKLYGKGAAAKMPLCTFSNKLALQITLALFILYFVLTIVKSYLC